MRKSVEFQDEWIENVLAGCNSKSTRRVYGVYLKQFRDYLSEEGLQFSRGSVNRFKGVLLERGVSGSAVGLFLAAVRRVAIEEVYDSEPVLANSIRMVKGVSCERQKARRFIDREGRRRMLQHCCDGSIIGTRNAAMLALLFGAGLRASELANMDLEHVTADSVTVKHGKGRKSRVVYINPAVSEYVEKWRRVKPEGEDKRALFLMPKLPHIRVHYGHVYYVFKRIGRAVGLGDLHPHLARGSYISELLTLADPVIVRKLAGHKSVNMTASYDLRDDYLVRKAVSEYVLE